jgi:tetratricopeptide (TPR) repeat protein
MKPADIQQKISKYDSVDDTIEYLLSLEKRSSKLTSLTKNSYNEVLGDLYFEKEDFSKSAYAYESANNYAKSSEAWNKFAQKKVQVGSHFLAATALSLGGMVDQAKDLFIKAGDEFFNKSDYIPAIQAYTLAKENDKLTLALEKAADQYMKQEDFFEAGKLFEKANNLPFAIACFRESGDDYKVQVLENLRFKTE